MSSIIGPIVPIKAISMAFEVWPAKYTNVFWKPNPVSEMIKIYRANFR